MLEFSSLMLAVNSWTFQPADSGGSSGHTPHTRCAKPPLRDPNLLYKLPSILSMLSALDHPGFISRILGATQQSKATRERDRQRQAMQQDDPNRDHETDVEKWKVFGDTFQKDVESINLLATVLLTANFSFLAIQSIDQNGLSYWPQRLSYTSLLFALGSILMGLAVRTPRFFTAYSSSYFQVMALVLGFPFELFLYSVFSFIAALIVHFGIHNAKFQYAAAIAIFSLVIMCLGMYWLVTEPQEKQLICSWKVDAGTATEVAGD
ncbi:hypothetical protein EDC04DRAFT_1637338 [Pisolithus marmoratus]|nr:hypothetical protein EDC04DRAFT_1637338 [Pisolithus marmoratus]